MALRKANPTSPGRRFVVQPVTEGLHKGRPVKSLVRKQSKTGGRNNQGRLTMRHRGGGHKQRYRVVDFRRNKDGVPALRTICAPRPGRNSMQCTSVPSGILPSGNALPGWIGALVPEAT